MPVNLNFALQPPPHSLYLNPPPYHHPRPLSLVIDLPTTFFHSFFIMARSHQKYFTADEHRMAIEQNGFLYNTIQHSYASDAEGMEIGFRQE